MATNRTKTTKVIALALGLATMALAAVTAQEETRNRIFFQLSEGETISTMEIIMPDGTRFSIRDFHPERYEGLYSAILDDRIVGFNYVTIRAQMNNRWVRTRNRVEIDSAQGTPRVDMRAMPGGNVGQEIVREVRHAGVGIGGYALAGHVGKLGYGYLKSKFLEQYAKLAAYVQKQYASIAAKVQQAGAYIANKSPKLYKAITVACKGIKAVALKVLAIPKAGPIIAVGVLVAPHVIRVIRILVRARSDGELQIVGVSYSE